MHDGKSWVADEYNSWKIKLFMEENMLNFQAKEAMYSLNLVQFLNRLA